MPDNETFPGGFPPSHCGEAVIARETPPVASEQEGQAERPQAAANGEEPSAPPSIPVPL